MTDQDLLRAYAEARDSESLGTFVSRYQDSVVRFATRLLGDRHAAQDVAQETFMAVARHPRKLLKVTSCHNWLLKVARNRTIDHLRSVSRRRKHTVAAGERAARASTAPPGPAAVLEKQEQRDQVLGEIERLTPRQRELLLLRVQEGKTYREIAEITGLTATNVGYILHHAVKALSLRLRDRSEELA